MRVLIVDDHDENAYYLRAILSVHGHAVDTARNGADALDVARAAPPDLVISDLLMPVMDGYTLLRHWRSDLRLHVIPFIVFTATYTEPEDEQLALNLGADAFLLKPADVDTILAVIAAVMQRARANRPSEGVAGPDDPVTLREYSEVLIRKLEQKSLQLEESNRLLQADVAARERAERALRESEARFRELADNIDDVFWLGDAPAGRIHYVSPAFEAVWGRSVEHLYQSPDAWLEAVHPEDRERVRRVIARATGGRWDEAYRVVRPDGSVRWVRTRAHPVRDASDGEVKRVAAVSRDVTEYRRLEEQLRQAQKMEAIGRLAGVVAHDFNNLLSVILSYATLVLDALEDHDPLCEDVEEIRRAGERATGLTRQLLAFSRQQVIEPQVVDLGRVVRETERMLRRLVGESVELVLADVSQGAMVYADRGQLEQVVMNLAVNARDAMPRGGRLTIEVRAVELDDAYVADHPGLMAGPHVLLAVSDTGSGMDQATRERIFEPFFTTKDNGTGLGLATVFGIVKQSHGHIYVYSELGLGTVIRIYLPVTERTHTTRPAARPAPATLHGHEAVLLVEDDRQVRETNRAILERHGYKVFEAGDGAAATELCEALTEPIDLLVTDVVMPRMSGRELAQRLEERRPGIKVLFVSGYTASAILQDGVLPDGCAFLEKPITPEALLRKVREVLAPTPPAA